MFDWFRRKSHQNKGDRIEDSSHTDKTEHNILEDQQNGSIGGGEEKLDLIDVMDDLSCGLLAIGTFGVLHQIPQSNAIMEHHFPDPVDDFNDVEAMCEANANFAGTRNVTLNANVKIDSLHEGFGATYIMASVKPTIPLEYASSVRKMNKPTSIGSAQKKSDTRVPFMKKFLEDMSGKEVGSGCNLNKVSKGGLFQRKIHPVDVAAPEPKSLGTSKVQGKVKKSKTWRNKCQKTLSCFTSCISPKLEIEDGHMETELKPANTNFGRKPYADERWINTDAEYVVLEF